MTSTHHVVSPERGEILLASYPSLTVVPQSERNITALMRSAMFGFYRAEVSGLIVLQR